MKRHGIRAFECHECGYNFELPTRDRFSPSGEDCPRIIDGYTCGNWCVPCSSYESDEVKVDNLGNLITEINR